jgi:hypothetical protein
MSPRYATPRKTQRGGEQVLIIASGGEGYRMRILAGYLLEVIVEQQIVCCRLMMMQG